MKKISDLQKILGLDNQAFEDLCFIVLGKKLGPTPFVADSIAQKLLDYHASSSGSMSESKAQPETMSGDFFSKIGIVTQRSEPKSDVTIAMDGSESFEQEVAPTLSVDNHVELEDLTKVAEAKGINAKIVSRIEPDRTLVKKNVGRKSGSVSIVKTEYKQRSDQQVRGEKRKKDEENEVRNIPKTMKEKVLSEAQVSVTLKKKDQIMMGPSISIKELSEKMGVPLMAIVKVMLQNKIMGGINTIVDFDTAVLLASEFNVDVIKEQETLSFDNLADLSLQDVMDSDKDAANRVVRAPIVTIMGHVDHGKTSLLDYIRRTRMAEGEAGGITQSIGASHVIYKGQGITFIDTPGHELFSSLRARGAKLTNIVVIVIAADDGLMPQTIESINHAKDSGVSIIIAITKVDKHKPDLDKIKADIAVHGLIPEDWGGDVPIVQVSSKTGQGIDELLETILLQAAVLDLKYNPHRPGVGVIIDVTKDARQGIVVSGIVLTGTLSVGHIVVAYNVSGKVKLLLDHMKKSVRHIHGGEPFQLLGFSEVPEPGRIIEVVQNEKLAQQKVAHVRARIAEQNTKTTQQLFLDMKKTQDHLQLKLLLKSDSPSSLEAMKHSIDQLVVPSNIKVKIVHSGIGAFSDSDIALAQASGALMIGFHTTISTSIKKSAQYHQVSVMNFDVIYELIDYLNNLLQGMIVKERFDVDIGKLAVLAVFFRKEKMMVIGGKIIAGIAKNGCHFRLMRDGVEIDAGEVTSLQRDQTPVSEVGLGYECGMKVRCSKKIEPNDVLELFMIEYR
ncbi:MAG: translation initiation factor IF-2 [Candidatus Absconditabacterales bacterium]|nr:translation initiation factor IF-2 [Candidatus Absconditabacterales bacterium]